MQIERTGIETLYSSITPEEIIEESVELKKAVDGLRDEVRLLAADNARLARELTLTDGKTINVDEVRKKVKTTLREFKVTAVELDDVVRAAVAYCERVYDAPEWSVDPNGGVLYLYDAVKDVVNSHNKISQEEWKRIEKARLAYSARVNKSGFYSLAEYVLKYFFKRYIAVRKPTAVVLS